MSTALFYKDKLGKRQDAELHTDVMHPEHALDAVSRAMKRGLSREEAEKQYGMTSVGSNGWTQAAHRKLLEAKRQFPKSEKLDEAISKGPAANYDLTNPHLGIIREAQKIHNGEH